MSRRPIPQPALKAARAAFVVGMAYAAIRVYWGLGGNWLLDGGRAVGPRRSDRQRMVHGGVIASGAHADQRALAWPAYLWDPLFLAWGLLVLMVLATTRPTVRGVT